MKNTNIIINAILAAAVAVLYIIHFTSGKGADAGKTAAPETSAETELSAGSNIAYIRIDTLMAGYDMAKDLSGELQIKMDAAQKDLEKRGRNLERDANDFQNRYTKGLMTRSQAEEANNKLMQQQQELAALEQQKTYELNEERFVMNNRIIDAIRTYVEKYNSEKGFDVIISTDGTSNIVLTGNPALDITDEILKGLNEEYRKGRK